MVEDSASASPPPPSTTQTPPSSDESRMEESDPQPPRTLQRMQSTELDSKEEEPELKKMQPSTAQTMTTPPQQPMSETEPLKQAFSEPEPLQQDMSEIATPEQVKLETELPNPETLETELPNPVTLEAEPMHQAKSETEKQEQVMAEVQEVVSEPEPPHNAPEQVMAETEQQPEIEPPQQVASETESPKQLTSESEPTRQVTPEPELQRHVDVSDWTEPEPPEAAVLEAAAAEPETELPEPEYKIMGESKTEPETHKLTPAEPDSAKPDEPAESAKLAAVPSRSLAEMMDREEDEAAEDERPENSPGATRASSGEEGKPTIQIPRSFGSFKEESNRISDLSESELNSLHELRRLVQEAITASEDSGGNSIWGIPLLKDDRSDVVLLKFLRARDFKAQEAYSMVRETLQWRKEFNIEQLIDENLGDDLDKVVFMQGHDKDSHPVCYNVYGEFQNKELYQKTFSDEEKRNKFLRWRIQFLEKSIRKLDFSSGGVSTICQVNDLKNSPGPGKKELRLATKQAVQLLQDNYPEFVSKQIFINVPWWYLAFYKMISPFMTQRSKSKLVFAGPSRSAETLFKYISPEQVPIQYGGLSVDNCNCDSEFSTDDTATEITVKPTTKQTVEIIIYEKCTIVWELRVVGWMVTYGAEFLPNNREAYTVIIQKPRKMYPTDEPVVSQSFKVGELGKILLTVDNPTAKKKKLVYRFKVKPICE